MKLISYRRRGPDKTTRLFLPVLLLLFLFFQGSETAAQVFENTAPSKFRITFADKDGSGFSVDEPEKFLSAESLQRRQKQGIPVTEVDLPVNPAYIQKIKETGAQILTVSKWFNSVTVQADSSMLAKIAELPFVNKNMSFDIKTERFPEVYANTQSLNIFDQINYGSSWLQVAAHNGHILHQRGYTGEGITIAVLDAGFANADTLRFFDRLFENGKILGTKDFVEPGNSVYSEATHGMSVLSIIGGYIDEELIGTAPDASFWLLRSEDGRSEYIIEEDNWIAAAEFADSAGAMVINTSLGYSVFNDSTQNHTYADMDGNTTRVSRAADMAAARGMIVVTSAGNQGNANWKYITAPADGDSVITVGAVDRSGVIATFSSRGPSSDGQVKPEVVATGQGVFVGNVDGNIRPGNGTSYAAPIITGLTASLWQANPEAKASEIRDAIIESSDRYNTPDDEYGYGLPDFHLADLLLKAKKHELESDARITTFPNPFSDELYIFFKERVNTGITIRLFDIAGKEVFQKYYPAYPDQKFLVIESDFDRLRKGIYIIRIDTGEFSANSKLIKF